MLCDVMPLEEKLLVMSRVCLRQHIIIVLILVVYYINTLYINIGSLLIDLTRSMSDLSFHSGEQSHKITVAVTFQLRFL